MRTAPRTLAPLLCLASLAACGSGDTVAAADEIGPPLRRVALAPLREAEPPAGPHLVERFEVGTSLPEGWTYGDAEARMEFGGPRRGGPWTAVTMDERKGLIRIPGPFDPARFNMAAVTLAVQGKVDLVVLLYDAEERAVLHTQPWRVDGDDTAQTVALDLPGILRLREPVQAIGFQFERYGKRPAFLAFDLLWSPLEGRLPDPGRPAPVALGDDIRSAVGLSSTSPLAGTFDAPPGALLRVAVGQPASVARGGTPPQLLLRVDGPQGRVAGKSVRLPRARRGREEWRTVELRLGRGGEGLRLTCRLEPSGDEPELCALAVPRVEQRRRRAPTVVLVTSDTHRADHLGAGGGDVRTPFLDGLAARGVLFEDCFSATNITNPSHASLFTALSPRDTGMVDNITALSDDAVTLAERFAEAGYQTVAAVSAGHLRHEQSGLAQGFDRMIAPGRKGEVDSAVTLEALDGLLEEARGMPLFLWLHVFDAHAPYAPPEDYRWLYWERGRDPHDPALPAPPREARPAWDKELRDLDYVRSQYRAEVSYLDDQLRRALSHPRFAEAVIAVTGDHGEYFGHHGVYWDHHALYREGLAVPLILAWPGAPAGARVSAPVSNLELGRSLLDLAGLASADFPGRGVLRFLEDPGAREPRFALSSFAHAASVELGGWFLVLNLRAHVRPPRERHQVELYDLSTDPDCLQDVLEREPERAADLRARLVAWLAEGPDRHLSHASAADAEVLGQLEALGYATDTGGGERAAGEPWFTPDDCDWCRRFLPD